MIDKDSPLQVVIPTQDQLHACQADPAALAEWVAALPRTHLLESARAQRALLNQLIDFIASYEQRYALLEALRPSVLETSIRLCDPKLKPSHNAPNDNPFQLGIQLRDILAVGYKQVMNSINTASTPPTLLIHANYHAFCCFGLTLRDTLLRYQNIGETLWTELLTLYRYAQQQGIEYDILQDMATLEFLAIGTVAIPLEQECIHNNFMRQILLVAANTHQLRYTDILNTEALIADLGQYVYCTPTLYTNSKYMLNLLGHQGPMLVDHAALANSAQALYFDFSAVITQLQQLYATAPTTHQKHLPNANQPSASLVQHLTRSWGSDVGRRFKRRYTDRIADIAIGLSHAHYFVANNKTLEQITATEHHSMADNDTSYALGSAPEGNRFMHKASIDVWSHSFDASKNRDPRQRTVPFQPSTVKNESSETSKQAHSTRIINESPSGYCIEFDQQPATSNQPNDLICLRETGRTQWNIGFIRWVSYVNKTHNTAPQNTLLLKCGIQMISPSATAVGIRVAKAVHKNALPPYLHGLLLPEMPLLNASASLIIPPIHLMTGAKVIINISGQTNKAVLGRTIRKNSGFEQFEFKWINSPNTCINTSATVDS